MMLSAATVPRGVPALFKGQERERERERPLQSGAPQKHHFLSVEQPSSALIGLYAPASLMVVSSTIHLHFSATARGSTHKAPKSDLF